jgi:hypothetical protein
MVNSYGLDDGSAVQPQMGSGSVNPQMATPAMADGGAIPEDDMLGDPSPNTDVTDYTGAMKVVREAMNFGRQQHGLPASRPQQADDENQEAIPDDEDSEGEASYAGGGAIADDIEASNNATDDGPQYGRPEVLPIAENGEAPPISSDNSTPPQVGDEQPFNAANDPNADNSGAAPVMGIPDDNSGALPVTPTQQSGDGRILATPQQIVRYLQGADAMPEEHAKALEASVASEAKHDPNATVLLAAEKANADGGPSAAFAYIQHSRQKYDAALSHARAALEGTPERPASLDSAVVSATKAFQSIPDKTDVRFMKDANGGISASVREIGKNGEQRYALTPEQFARVTDIAKDAQFDRVMAAGGAAGLLQQVGAQPANYSISRAGGTISQDVLKQFQSQTSGGTQRQQDERNAPAGYPMEPQADVGVRTGPMRSGRVPERGSYDDNGAYHKRTDARNGSIRQDRPDNTSAPINILGGAKDRTEIGGIDQEPNEKQARTLEQIRARNEGKSGPRDRMAEIEARNKGALERAKLVEDAKTGRATAGIDSRTKMAAERIMEQARAREAANGRNAASNAERALVGKIVQGQKLNPQEQQYYDQIVQGAARAPAAQAPGTAPTNQPTAQQPKQLSAQDQAAVAWANANPNDPRAAKIKQLHGVQ